MLDRLSNSPGFLILLMVASAAFLGLIGIHLSEQIEAKAIADGQHLAFLAVDIRLPFWIKYTLCLLILGLNFWQTKKINDQHRFAEGTIIPFAIFYLVSISLFSSSFFSLSTLIGSSLCLLMLNITLAIYNQPNVTQLVFSASVVLGITSILFYPFILFWITLLIAISIFRTFELREYLMAIIGLALPLFYLFSLYYLLDIKEEIPPLKIGLPEFRYSLSYLGIALFTVMASIAWIRVILLQAKMVVRQQNQMIIFSAFMVIACIISLFLNPSSSIVLLLAPLSLCFHIFYQNLRKKWVAESFLLLLSTISIVEKIVN